METVKEKHLFRGYFNFRHQLRIEYARAYSGKQAKVQMMRRIAKRHNVPYEYVIREFSGSQDNFKIEIET